MVDNQAKSLNLLPILAIFAVGLLLTLPAIVNGSLNGHDFPLHLRWSNYFSSQFWRGDLYPRWLMDMNAGLGSPTFFFYPPIPYYFTSIFHLFFVNDANGWYPLLLSTLLALVASGLTAYFWLKTICDRNSALIASILYMALPYHLAVDLYARFSFAEYWTFVWVPLIFYFSNKIVNGHKSNILGFAVSYALLGLTHLPTLVIFSIFPVLYVLFLGLGRKRKKALTRILLGMIMGIGLSAIFWLPALTTQKYVSLDSISQGEFFYANNFLFTEQSDGVRQDFWRYLEVMALLTGGLAVCTFLTTCKSSITNSRLESKYWIATTLVAIFMTLPLSRPVWEVLPPLQKVQFPWRFGTVYTVATTALLALAISSLKPSVNLGNKKKLFIVFLLVASLLLTAIEILLMKMLDFPGSTVLIAAIILLLSVGIYYLIKQVNILNAKPFLVGLLLITSLILSSSSLIKGGLYKASNLNTPDQIRQQLERDISKDAREYRPREVPPTTFDSFFLSQLGKNSAKASVTAGQGSLLIQQWKPREIVLQTNGTTNLWLTIKQFYYPEWTARIKGESQSLTVQPSKPEGLLQVGIIPRGKQEVIVTLKAGMEERVGQITSAVFVLITLLLLFWFWRSDRDIQRG
jgi:hypothetical protein